ncbi:MAG: hypothetical protein KDE27_31905 [Planctomycetes bacterium]|nr:hypothetical protein [Planctomycetota bacterium]
MLPTRAPLVPLTTLLCATSCLLAQMPEPPAIARDVLGVDGLDPANPTFTRPHMPGLRVTHDGRIGVMVEGLTPAFALMMPEKMTAPFLLNPAGAYTMSSTQWSYMNNNSAWSYLNAEFAPGADQLYHACLWDDGPPVATRIGGIPYDIYDLKVLVTSTTDINPPNLDRRMRLHMTPVQVQVANPKTTSAAITSITRTGPTVSSPQLPYYSTGFEPVVCGDGRLLIVRLDAWQNGGVQWTDPNTGVSRSNAADIVYAYYPTGTTVDPMQWMNLIPITFAPEDLRINTKFGFAMAPFRDSEGNLIPAAHDLGGSYPWIDREAKNLFFETLGDRSKFYYAESPPGTFLSRYFGMQIQNDLSWAPAIDTGGKHQGVSFLGLWSHGKTVMIDNLNNDIDYAMGAAAQPQTRDVRLFDDGGQPTEYLRMGYGRATTRMPPGENDNGNIIDSLEARFTYRQDYRPIAFKDVAWPLTNGKQADELGFDDYLDPDALVIMNSAGSLTFTKNPWNNQNTIHRFEYHDGWLDPNGPFSQPVRLQNAATGLTWKVPAYGLAHGNSRLEPAATGGVHGKGFWLGGDNGVVFDMPDNDADVVATTDCYAGVFVDCRHADDQTERTVLTFPDGTSLRLYGRRQVVYADAGGATVHRITMPPVIAGSMGDLLPDHGWAHLGLQIRAAGSRIDLCLDGLLFDRWSDPSESLFQMVAGPLTLGKVANASTAGIVGWVDELKVFAHTFDPETLCNLAGGTLIGLDPAYAGEWKTQFADRFPAWIHGEVTAALRNRGETTYPAYACYHRYDADHGAHLGNLPAQTHSLRASVHFPEGPLYHDAPRPDSLQNAFCAYCHHQGGKLGLGLKALMLDPTTTAANDARRQPMQPAAKIHGWVPALLIDTVNPAQPSTSMSSPATGFDIDTWMMPSYQGPATVQSFTVVDPTTGAELFELDNNATIDPAIWGTASVRLRANLDSAQGSVTAVLGGQSATTATPPHDIAATLTPGSHTLTATPVNGGTVLRTFTVPTGPRVLANYRNGYRTGSPAPHWSYAWNDGGDVLGPAAYRTLCWSPTQQHWNASGLGVPDGLTQLGWGLFNSYGGHPGRSSSQQGGGAPDRFVLAGWDVVWNGTYELQNAWVRMPNASSDGGRIVVLLRDATSVQVAFDSVFPAVSTFNVPLLTLPAVAGQTIWVGVGPRSVDSYDSFQLDFDIAIQ